MKAVASVLTSVLPALLANAPLTPEKVTLAWRLVVGPTLERLTSVTLSKDGVLEVTSKDPRWAREAQRATPTLVPRLQGLLGAGAVRKIVAAGS